MLKKLGVLFEIIVPEYIFLSIINIIIICLISVGNLPYKLIFGIIAITLAIVGFNTLNMYFDKRIDKLAKPKRALPSGKISNIEVLKISLISFALAIVISSIKIELLFVILAFILFAIIYTHPKIFFRRFWISTPFFGTFLYAIIPLLISLAVNKVFPPSNYLLLFVFATSAISITKEFEDYKIDRKFGINSFVNQFGEKNTKLFIFGLLIALILTISLENITYLLLLAPTILFVKVLFTPQKTTIKTQGKIVTYGMALIIIYELFYLIIFNRII